MAETDLILAAQTTLIEPSRADNAVGPLTATAQGRLRVESKPGYFDPVTGTLTTSGTAVATDVTAASNVVLHLANTGTAAMAAGVFNFEGSIDSTDGVNGNWFVIQAVRTDSNTIETGRAASSLANGTAQAYAWELSVNAIRWFRVRCSTTVSAGAIAAWTIIRGSYATEPVAAVPTHAVTVTGSATVTPTAAATNYGLISAASTNAVSIKATSGQLFELTVFNPTAALIYIKLYNKASAPTVGTDVPLFSVPVPVNGVVALEFGAVGKRFVTGIALATTLGPLATDVAAIAVGAQISATYL